jgi:hypothetical protein
VRGREERTGLACYFEYETLSRGLIGMLVFELPDDLGRRWAWYILVFDSTSLFTLSEAGPLEDVIGHIFSAKDVLGIIVFSQLTRRCLQSNSSICIASTRIV